MFKKVYQKLHVLSQYLQSLSLPYGTSRGFCLLTQYTNRIWKLSAAMNTENTLLLLLIITEIRFLNRIILLHKQPFNRGKRPLNEDPESFRCSLIIWPKIFGSYQFGLSLTVPNQANNGDEKLSFQTYGFMLDENMKPTDPLSDSEKKILEDNKEKVSMLYDKAQSMWEIGG